MTDFGWHSTSDDVLQGRVSAKGGGVRPYSIDPERAKSLWAQSEGLVGMREEHRWR